VLVAGVASAAEGPSPIGDPFTADVELVVDGLTAPVYMTAPPDGSGRLFVLDQVGLVRIIAPDGTLLPEPFLDLRSKIVDLMEAFDERGLLGLAFHPDYATNGRFFVYYSAPLRDGAPAGYSATSTISEFHVSADDPNRADPSSEHILLQVDKPQFNHNGGTLLIGPDDGYLYISIGDGGDADDVGPGHVEDWYADNAGGNGQDVEENLLGNILRIDVDSGDPYGIPADNPFFGRDGLDEIYAYGLRNPYRMSFDMGGSGMLIASDAGQNLWEEVDVITRGGNYGWNVKEGTHCFSTANPDVSPAECPDSVDPDADHPDAGAPLLDPVIEYANHHQPGGIGAVVVGGYVYRGDDIPQFRGRYIFGDWSAEFEVPDGTVLLAKMRKKGLWQIHEVLIQSRPDGRLGEYILAFGQDPAGEVYILTTEMTGPTGTTGKVYRIVPPGHP
jgi:glucose/arabinose dehydrogenase